MTLLSVDANQLKNTKITDYKANFNVFSTNSDLEIKNVMKSSATTSIMRTILASLYNLVENGSQSLLNQMLSIDSAFIDQILSLSDTVERNLLIATAICCSAVILLTTFFLPYMFALQGIAQQMVEFVSKTNRESVSKVLKNCRAFNDYLETSSYLGAVNGEEASSSKTVEGPSKVVITGFARDEGSYSMSMGQKSEGSLN